MNLINKSSLSSEYNELVIHYAIDNSESFGFFNNENFLRAVEIILNSFTQDDVKYVSITSLTLCLKNEDIINDPQKKSNIVLYALLNGYGAIHTYPAQEIPHAPCVKRPHNKRSDVKMSDYLSDNQMIKDDISWLKNKDRGKFKELCNQVNKIPDKEVKETFENYLNQINSQEKHNELKYTATTLVTISVVIGITALAEGNIVIGIIAAALAVIGAIMLGGYLLCGSKLECVDITCENKESKLI